MTEEAMCIGKMKQFFRNRFSKELFDVANLSHSTIEIIIIYK